MKELHRTIIPQSPGVSDNDQEQSIPDGGDPPGALDESPELAENEIDDAPEEEAEDQERERSGVRADRSLRSRSLFRPRVQRREFGAHDKQGGGAGADTQATQLWEQSGLEAKQASRAQNA